jgi:hypothetical protein
VSRSGRSAQLRQSGRFNWSKEGEGRRGLASSHRPSPRSSSRSSPWSEVVRTEGVRVHEQVGDSGGVGIAMGGGVTHFTVNEAPVGDSLCYTYPSLIL